MDSVLLLIAGVLLCGMFLSLGFAAFGQPMILGYIITGVLLGSTLGNFLDAITMHYVSEFAMMFLLFLVGLELDLEQLKKTWMKTLGCFFAQVLIAIMATLITSLWYPMNFFFGVFIVSNILLSSTAIVVTLLENFEMMKNKMGSMIISILIIQDLSIVPILLILKSANSQISTISMILQLIFAIGLLVFCVLFFGKPVKDHAVRLEYRNLLKKAELTTLIGLSICVTSAACAEMLHLSASYGAFIAGLILGNRWDRELLLDAFVPINSLMMMLFFFSVGIRLTQSFMKSNGSGLIFCIIYIMIIKMFMHMCSFKVIGINFKASIFNAALLSQLSEFSFVLIDVSLRAGILTNNIDEFFITLATFSLIFGAVFPVIVKTLQQLANKRQKHNDAKLTWDY